MTDFVAPTEDLLIGESGVGSQNYLGAVSNFHTWDSARTQQEIRDFLFKMPPTTEPGLTHLYKPTPTGFPPIWEDLVGTVDGTINGARWLGGIFCASM